MRRVSIVLTAAVLLLLSGCGESKQSDDLLTVDVTAKYPKKDLVLQDMYDVEYIPLETTKEFATHGYVRAIGDDVIVVRNYINDGDLYFFDRKDGKALKRFNRRGGSGEEYVNALDVILDDTNGDVFINDGAGKKMLLYDKDGNFKYRFAYNQSAMYRGVFNFDSDHLICFDTGGNAGETDANRQSYEILSKQDGSVTRKLEFNFGEKKRFTLVVRNPSTGQSRGAFMDDYPPLLPHGDNQFIISELSSDTSFLYSTDHKMTPITVRTPSIQSMSTEVFLFPTVIANDYYFMIKIEKSWDFDADAGFPVTNLLYDRKEKAIYECDIYNSDYTDKQPIKLRHKFANKDIACWQILDVPELLDAYESGKLTGKLKEVVAQLDEESNPVLLLARYKK